MIKKSIYSKEQSFMVRRLKKARDNAGLDQKKVAKLLKRTQSNISRIESGQRRIDIVQLITFAKIYKKKIGFFILKEKKWK